MFVDAHCHFDQQSAEDNTVLNRFDTEKINVFANSVDLASSRASLYLSKVHKDLLVPFAGVHPSEVQESCEEGFTKLLESESRIGGIGEIGLDPTYAHSLGAQEKALEFFLRVADGSRLPVCVHSRKAEDVVIQKLKSFNIRSVLFHWFSGNDKQLQELIDNAWFASFGPTILYSKRIQEICRRISRNLILTETDSPVRYSDDLKSTITSQHLIPSVVLKISQIRGENFQSVASVVWDNALRFLGGYEFNKFTR